MQNNQLTGSIPSSIGSLSNLADLYLYSNQLTGSIPSSIGSLSNLADLYLYSNQLTGSIPSSIRSLSKLIYLDLNTNQLTGSIPSSIGSLSNLVELYLLNNQLTGNIPSSIGSLSNLQDLYLFNNQLTGSIPSSIGSLSNLVQLYLDINQLTGSIPSSIGSLTNLLDLDLDTNQLTGSIPSSIGSLSNLVQLYLDINQLTGNIPSSIRSLTNLLELDLMTNQLTGSIPSSIGSLSNLVVLFLSTNQFTGSIPSSIGSLSNLLYLDLMINQLTGSIPSSIGSLSNLVEVYLDINQLTGSIPSSIGFLSNLFKLYLYSNQLTGSIPSSIGSLPNLFNLYLYDNQLTGSIPSSIGSLSSLLDLYLYSNQLTGSIPSSIRSLPNLLDLDLMTNQLTGSIPSSIGSLTNLLDLYLFNNQLTGSIPSSIGSLSNLFNLDLNTNQLTGSIPSSIGSLSKLIYLDLSTNQLTGSIPSDLFSLLAFLTGFDVSSNQLSGRLLDQMQSSNRKQPLLQELMIANNLFTGPFSSLDFSSVLSLINLDAASNCFTGSISDSICEISGSLQSLTLGGAGTNPACSRNDDTNRHRPLFVHGYFSPLGLEGSIPPCIFSFKVLTTLQLSGNKLQGTISELSSSNQSLASSLNVLLLSNNALTGTIPVSIQRHAFLQLDLSNNRLQGTLVDDFVVSSEQTTLGLSVNRLSGPLPQSLKKSDISSFSNLSSMSILATNIFGCDSSELPEIDSSEKSYSCGSYEMEVACYVYVTLAGAMLAIAVLYKILFRMKLCSGGCIFMIQRLHMTQSWYQSFKEFSMQHTFLSFSAPSAFLAAAAVAAAGRSPFPDTIAFLVLINLISKWTKRYLLFSLLMIPVFVAFSLAGSSILSFTYAYILSSTFLHGLGPVVFLIVMLLLLFSVLVMLYRGLRSLFELYRTREDRNQAWAFNRRAYAVVIALHVVNVGATITVNALYVSTLLSQNTLSQTQRLIVQVLVGAFKLVWNGIYIPSAMNWLDRYIPHSSSMQNYMVMSLINFIIAPCIATIASNQSCFYYVFVSQSAIQTSPVEHCLIFDSNDKKPYCVEYETVSLDLASRPPFQYSYACGSALLVAYIPVLLYSYTIAGIVLPSIRLLMMHYEGVVDKLSNDSFFRIGQFWDPNRVRGRQLITNYLIQIIVLLTFGLASPLLSIVIVTSISSNVLLHQTVVGRLWQTDMQKMAASAGVYQAKVSDVEVNPAHADNAAADIISNTSTHHHPNVPANMLTLENLDMKDAWKSVFVNGVAMMTTVSGFWAYLFFDMISDRYGWVNGLITSSLFGFLFPLLIWAVYRVIPSSWENVKELEKAMVWNETSLRKEPAAATEAVEMTETQHICVVIDDEHEIGLRMEGT
jgi:Leucine-rich repeat (LRR) protein